MFVVEQNLRVLAADLNREPRLLKAFARRGLLGRFPRPNLAAGELAATGQWNAGRANAYQERVAMPDDGDRDELGRGQDRAAGRISWDS